MCEGHLNVAAIRRCDLCDHPKPARARADSPTDVTMAALEEEELAPFEEELAPFEEELGRATSCRPPRRRRVHSGPKAALQGPGHRAEGAPAPRARHPSLQLYLLRLMSALPYSVAMHIRSNRSAYLTPSSRRPSATPSGRATSSVRRPRRHRCALTSPGPGLSARTRPSRWTWARGELMWPQSVASELRLPGERLRPDWMVAFGAGITMDRPCFPRWWFR